MLRRIFVAAVFTQTLVAPGGYRVVASFLQLAGLERFIATSYGAIRRAVQKLEREVLAFGEAERTRLSEAMIEKLITLALDETFHPEVCLVALEPVSGFILVEEYAPKRDGVEWARAIAAAKEGMNVKVIQATSDEASGILSLVKVALGHHSPDVFHVQHEVSKGTAATLAAAVRSSETALLQAQKQHTDVVAEKAAYEAATPQERGPGRPPNFDKRIEDSRDGERRATFARDDLAVKHRDEMRAVVRGIGDDYHPFDLTTGNPRTATTVETELTQRFQSAREIAKDAGLPDRCSKAIEKAARVLTAMVATIAFVHRVVAERLAAAHGSDDEAASQAVRHLLATALIPAMYLSRAARKARTSDDRERIRATANALRATVESATEWLALDEKARASAWTLAASCADLFQRASSCVEGRNGRLSLFHAGFHVLTLNKLKALTVLHNYFITRADGKTAAERFFGQETRSLFEWLVERCEGPPTPAARRQKTRAIDGF